MRLIICVTLLFGFFQNAYPIYGQEPDERFDALLAQTKSSNPDEQVDAFIQLAEFPDRAEQLLIPLVEAMIGADTRVGEAAQFAANQMGEALAAYSDTQLDATEQKQVAAAAEMIYRLGNVGIASTPKLVKLLKSDDPRRRLSGLWGLIYLENTDPSVAKAIEPFLDDPDFRIRIVACRALATIGPPAVELSGKLKNLVETGNQSTRSQALMALGAIGPNPEFDVVELVEKYLDADVQPVRDRALVAAMYLGPHAARLEERVSALMKDPEKSVQPQAALTLWKITGKAEPSLSALLEMIQSFDLEYEALSALLKMGDAAAPAVEEIAKHLSNPDSSIRALTVEILGELGPAAAKYRERLEQMAQEDNDPLVRFYCTRTLKRLAQSGGQVEIR